MYHTYLCLYRHKIIYYMANPKNIQERLWDRYKVNAETGCWDWQGAISSQGYGVAWDNGKTVNAHRLSYETINGPLSSRGEIVRHTCDRPCCINPNHLIIGTQKDNIADMDARGRRNKWRLKNDCCPQGHPYDSFGQKGQRKCSICRRAYISVYESNKAAKAEGREADVVDWKSLLPK